MSRSIDMESRIKFLTAAHNFLGGKEIVTRQQIADVLKHMGLEMKNWPHWLVVDQKYRASRGMYKLPYDLINKSAIVTEVVSETASKIVAAEDGPDIDYSENASTTTSTIASVPSVQERVSLKLVDNIHDAAGNRIIHVPEIDPTYIPWGHHEDIKKIIKSRKFMPCIITGESGNGKTMMLTQICAELNREFIRIQITKETTEKDLIGGFRLVNGETVWQDGPVTEGAIRGAIVLLDENNKNNRLMCLQAVMEGQPLFIKELNRTIVPAEGFNVLATANSKGHGDASGRYITEECMDEASLERWRINYEQEFAPEAIERTIISRNFKKNDLPIDDEFINSLVKWSMIVRTTYKNGGIDQLVSTRRLVYIVEAFAIFGDRMKAIGQVLSRFDESSRKCLIALYEGLSDQTTTPETGTVSTAEKDIPF